MNRLAMLIATVLVTGAAQAAPETYTIDNSHTYPQFTYTHLGFSKQTQKFDKTSGTVTLDRAAKTGAVDVVIDATSVNTGFALFNQHIQEPDYFDTAKYPTITFKSSKMTFNGDEPASLTGDLTIKGVTKPVTLSVTRFKCSPISGLKGDTCVANANVTIKRSEFNMGKYRFLAGNDVALNLVIGAVKSSTSIQVASRQ